MRIVNSKVHFAASNSRQSHRWYGRTTSVRRVTKLKHPKCDKGEIF